MAAVAVRKDTSSSSGKIFAKPSKEWVLPERAKPGRKVSQAEPDDKRQSQNRQSQRAHRARKTDYIQTLEARLRQYEADEIHSNVRLQEVARALKTDNERLKGEVGQLKTVLEGVMREREEWKVERAQLSKAIRELQAGASNSNRGTPMSPLPRLEEVSTNSPALKPSIRNLLRQSPGLSADTPPSRPIVACPICPDPDPDCPCQRAESSIPPIAAKIPLSTLTLAAQAVENHDGAANACGLCDSKEECLCRTDDDVHDDPVETKITTSIMPSFAEDDGGCGLCTGSSFCACKSGSSPVNTTSFLTLSPDIPSTSSLSHFKPTTGSVALSLKRKRGEIKASIWEIHPTPAEDTKRRSSSAVCSGDPAHCEVCKNDSFGQEFCSNLFANPQTGSSGMADVPDDGSMTPDKAWKALKAHPNSKFASLSLLADVVAGRSPAATHADEPVVKIEEGVSPGPEAPPIKLAKQSHDSASVNRLNGRPGFAIKTSGLRDALRLLDESLPSEIRLSTLPT